MSLVAEHGPKIVDPSPSLQHKCRVTVGLSAGSCVSGVSSPWRSVNIDHMYISVQSSCGHNLILLTGGRKQREWETN